MVTSVDFHISRLTGFCLSSVRVIQSWTNNSARGKEKGQIGISPTAPLDRNLIETYKKFDIRTRDFPVYFYT